MNSNLSISTDRVINLSVNPSYYCNFRCDFCYLTPKQLSDRKRLDLNELFKRVDEVLEHSQIGTIDLYGGEPLLLPETYINEMKKGFHDRGIDDLNIITNMSVNNPAMFDLDWLLSVSYDFDAREKNELVFQQMLKMNRQFSILTLATPKVMAMDIDEFIGTFNMLSHLSCVEIKPYSSNQANQLQVSYLEYEEFVKKLCLRVDDMNFEFINLKQIKESVNGLRNSFSDDHVYITPEGRFAVLEFDKNDNEFFLELGSIDEYFDWCKVERDRVDKTACRNCSYYGNCLSEHLRDVKIADESCSGFINLLDWGVSNGFSNKRI